jgi:hypothetical protein
MPRTYDLVGQTFSKLTVVERDTQKTGSHTRWICECDCGNTKSILQSHLLRGNTKSCGCLLLRRGSDHPNSTAIGLLSGDRWTNIKSARGRAKRKEVPFTITQGFAWELFLKQNKKCALSGLPITLGITREDETTASLDRIDPLGGYTEDNVQWVHKHVNYMKGIFEQDYFVEICQRISSLSQEQ